MNECFHLACFLVFSFSILENIDWIYEEACLIFPPWSSELKFMVGFKYFDYLELLSVDYLSLSNILEFPSLAYLWFSLTPRVFIRNLICPFEVFLFGFVTQFWLAIVLVLSPNGCSFIFLVFPQWVLGPFPFFLINFCFFLNLS